MNPRTSPSLPLVTVLRAVGVSLLASVLSSGCHSPRTARIHENLELFQSLDPFSQKLVQEGLVNFGFTSQLVTMALGRPNRVTVAVTAAGPVETWTYRNFLYGTPTAKLGIDPALPQRSPMSPPGGTDATSLGGTGTGQSQPSFSPMIDMPVGTLILELLEGCVVAIHIEP